MRRTLLVVVLLAGCHSSASTPSVEMLPELRTIIQPKPDNGYQVVLPVVKALAPATDTEICTWTNLIVDKQTDVRAVEAYQTIGGHHIVMFTTAKVQPPGTTRACTDDDMATFRFGAGAGAEGTGSKNSAPANLVFRIPAGAQVVLNHHYINATPHAIDSQSAMNIWLGDPGQAYVPVGSMAILDTSMRLPPGPSTLDINCTMPKDINAWMLLPHMHAYGSRAVIEHIHGTTIDKLFDVQWVPEFTFHPPTMQVDPSMPFALKSGDQLHVRCEWNNTTSGDLTFGLEMCVGFVMFVNADGLDNLQCDKGQWGTF